MIRIAVAGCTGKMGRALIQEIMASNDLQLTAASVSPNSEHVKTDVGTLAGLAPLGLFPVKNLKEVINDFDVLIDFTKADATMSHLALCINHGKKMVIGTTALNEGQQQAVKDAAKDIPIVFAPNMSVGLNICLQLIQDAAKWLGSDVDIHISEAHHKHKKDSPSGTALKMAQTIEQVLPGKTLEHSAIRAGDIVGDHSVLFAWPGESIEITHRANNRHIFAIGALRCARWLQDKKVGLYGMPEVLGLHT